MSVYLWCMGRDQIGRPSGLVTKFREAAAVPDSQSGIADGSHSQSPLQWADRLFSNSPIQSCIEQGSAAEYCVSVVTQRPIAADTLPRNTSALRKYRRTIASDRCPVCFAIARSEHPASPAAVTSPARSEWPP